MQENSLDVIIDMINVFIFNVYAFFGLCACLYLSDSIYVYEMWIHPELLLETFSISTPVGDFVLEKIVYHDCVMSVNQNDTMAYKVELEMVDFDVILSLDWFHLVMYQLIIVFDLWGISFQTSNIWMGE